MFDSLTQRLNRTLKNISGRGRITADNIKDTLREVRMALLEADVALPVVRAFVDRVKERTLGVEVSLKLSPGQEFIKAVYAELVAALGGDTAELSFAHQPPAVLLLAGLQGAGKTTTAAKLALYLKERLQKKVLLVSVDTYRPAAAEQLAQLAAEIGVDCFPVPPGVTPRDLAVQAREHARVRAYDALIVDTAGRLGIDQAMMDEISGLQRELEPTESLFVVDALTGQDAAVTAKAFADALPLTGVILTKADGDARGGAALSVRTVTGRPIKFIGTGEKVAMLEPFHPERIASRILDMGDLLSLIEDLERHTDREQTAALTAKLKAGGGFTFNEFLLQIRQMKKLGGVTGLMDKLPGMGKLSTQIKAKVDDRALLHMEAIICSMTKKERLRPEIIKASRKRRIAAGAGVTVHEINVLLQQFDMTQKMMKKMRGRGGMRKMGELMRAVTGGMPPPGRFG